MIRVNRIDIDPNDKYSHVSPAELLNACGLILPWLLEYNESDDDIKDYLAKRYGFGDLIEMTGGEINENHTYLYPEDPPSNPLVIYRFTNDRKVIQYSYGIVAIEMNKDEWFVTRMD